MHILTIYLGNLSYRATIEDLTELFAEYGTVKRISLPADRETERMQGFAFVELAAETQEDVAITELNGAACMGRQLKLNRTSHKKPVLAS